MQESLEQVNPPRLFLDTSPPVKDHSPLVRVHALSDAIAHAAHGWSKLRRIDVSSGFALPHELMESLFALPQVEYISGTIDPDSEEFTFEWMDEILRPILERPTLKVLQIRNGQEWLSLDLSIWGAELFGVREKLYLGEGQDMISLAAFPEQNVIIPEPTSLPELPDKIWARILWIATHHDGYDPTADDYETMARAYTADRTPLDTGLHVLLVCKRFYRIGLEHLYSHPFLFRKNTDRFLEHLQKNPDLYARIRVLYIDPVLYVDPYADEPAEMFKQLSAPLVNLVRVNNGIQVFPHLLKYYVAPPDMRKQRLAPTDMITPSMFLKLPNLRRVVLNGGRAGRLGEAPQGDLLQLECLHLYEPGIGLTKLFRDMNLPRLRQFGFRATSQAAITALDFLKVHGAKLSVLAINIVGKDDYKQPIFDHCPNITELRLESIGRVPALIPFLRKSKAHPRIDRITLPGVSLARQDPARVIGRIKTLDPLERWMTLFDFLSEHRDKLPALAELRVLGDFDWPVNQWQYGMHTLWTATPVALKLHDLGIALADKTGTRWRRFNAYHSGSQSDSNAASELSA
ncbi:hypothetical protein C8T65DRAFT_628435 [Cerioporus squamosus]|nr:hypothetical protein C8T65DRAFT_628435 [Cerioporus squamosus]